MKSLNFLGDGLEEESSNEDQITEMIKEIGKYNDVTEFSFLRMTSDEYNRIFIIETSNQKYGYPPCKNK